MPTLDDLPEYRNMECRYTHKSFVFESDSVALIVYHDDKTYIITAMPQTGSARVWGILLNETDRTSLERLEAFNQQLDDQDYELIRGFGGQFWIGQTFLADR